MNNEYVCDLCHDRYIKGQSDEDAMHEMVNHFPDMDPIEGICVLCDDCYIAVTTKLGFPE